MRGSVVNEAEKKIKEGGEQKKNTPNGPRGTKRWNRGRMERREIRRATLLNPPPPRQPIRRGLGSSVHSQKLEGNLGVYFID